MGEHESKSQSPHEDRYLSPEFLVLLAENTEGLQERVEDILEKMRQDENISEITDELCQQKSYLTGNLTEVSRMLKVLADQISSTVRHSTPVGLYFALTRDTTVLCVSKTEDSKSSVSLSSDSSSESTLFTNNGDTQKDKETKAPEIKNLNSDENGNEKEKVIELETEVSDLKHAHSVSNRKIKEMGIELEASKKKGAVSEIVIKDLKQQRSDQESKVRQKEQELLSVQALLGNAKKHALSYADDIEEFLGKLAGLSAGIEERDNIITELSNNIKQYRSDISQLKTTHNTKENNWKTCIGKLRKELEKKDESIDNLTKKLVNVQAATHLSSLQVDHVWALVSFDIAQTVANELTERVLELEKEVDRQREVISVRDVEKREAIRQITSVLAHYKSAY